MLIEAFAFNALFLEQSVATNIQVLAIEQVLGLADYLDTNIQMQRLRSYLYFSHSATSSNTIDRTIAHSLTFTQSSLPRVFVEGVSTQLLLSQDSTQTAFTPLVRTPLLLVQDVTVEVAKGLHSALTLAQTVSFSITKELVVEQAMTLLSEGAGFLPSRYWTSYEITL